MYVADAAFLLFAMKMAFPDARMMAPDRMRARGRTSQRLRGVLRGKEHAID